MTQGRVYVTVNHDDKIKYITYYDNDKKRMKTIDVNGVQHTIDGKKVSEHTHKGYFHDEKGTFELSKKERRMVARVKQIWENR